MSFESNKITDAEILANGVQSRPNKLTGTAAQNKAVFDALVANLVAAKINALIDELLDAGCAAQLGVDTVSGITADTVQEALEALSQSIQDVTQGTVADGSISTAKLAEAAVTAAKLAGDAVTTAKLADGAVTRAKIADGAINGEKLANNAVSTAQIANKSITGGIGPHFATNTKLF